MSITILYWELGKAGRGLCRVRSGLAGWGVSSSEHPLKLPPSQTPLGEPALRPLGFQISVLSPSWILDSPDRLALLSTRSELWPGLSAD